jgi:AraC-like DNA-binding protein
MPDTSSFSDAFLMFVNQCQATIGGVATREPGGLGPLWSALGRWPHPRTEPERLLATAFVADVLTGLRFRKLITRVPTWAELCALFGDSSPEGMQRRLAALRLLEVHGPQRGRPGFPNLIGQALDRLAESYSDPNESLAGIAKRMGVTAGHLGRVLRRRTGKPFRRHLHEIRTQHAEKLLVKGLPVKEVATMVGYSSVSEFDRQFRVVFGMTPSAYRALRSHGVEVTHAAGDLDESVAV